jgi:3'-phosphoadenosine 5'-phosphosulfate sulfotransferase (PAPS reductase)/FAD synthetase
MDVTTFDIILVNSSAGKDSQAMLDYVIELADAAGVRDRVVVVHCDLGRVEWKGTRELAQEQAQHYGVRFEVVARAQDLLAQIEYRGKFPDAARRYCTSDQKTSQVTKLITKLVAEKAGLGRRVRVLNCLGIRAAESPARAKKLPLGPDKASNGKREVVRWLPIFAWSEAQVWDRIKASGVRYHWAYDAGMPRLSCCFCVLASKPALVRAAQLNPELLDEYIAVEDRIQARNPGHTFKQGMSLRVIRDEAARAPRSGTVEGWAC